MNKNDFNEFDEMIGGLLPYKKRSKYIRNKNHKRKVNNLRSHRKSRIDKRLVDYH